MPAILVVCTANICRSPMAEALLRDRLQAGGVEGDWQVSSAGTWAIDGVPASANGVTVMNERGLDISGHLSRVVTEEMLRRADLVLTMTAGHAESLRAEFPAQAARIFLLTEMAGIRYDVADPYGRDLDAYRATAGELERLVRDGLTRIVDLAWQMNLPTSPRRN